MRLGEIVPGGNRLMRARLMMLAGRRVLAMLTRMGMVVPVVVTPRGMDVGESPIATFARKHMNRS